MATPRKQHLKRNIGIAVLVIVIMLIGVVASFASGFFTAEIGGSTPTQTPLSGAPLQTPTSTPTPQPTSASAPIPTSTSVTSPTPSSSSTATASNAISPSGYYLNGSRIFVVSADSSYGSYPYPTVTNPFGLLLAENGEPCVIIDVTIRNDYSTQNPPPNPNPDNPAFVFVYLTAQIFNGENQIDATDITPAVGFVNGGAYAPLSSGESATLTIYLATNNTDITSFQIVTRFISGIPVP